MRVFLYKEITKRLLQTTRAKTMPMLPMFPNAVNHCVGQWAASNPERCPLVITTKMGSLDSSWTPEWGVRSHRRL